MRSLHNAPYVGGLNIDCSIVACKLVTSRWYAGTFGLFEDGRKFAMTMLMIQAPGYEKFDGRLAK